MRYCEPINQFNKKKILLGAVHYGVQTMCNGESCAMCEFLTYCSLNTLSFITKA